MNDVIELSGNPADEVYATQDDFGFAPQHATEQTLDELPFHIPRD